MELYDAMRTTGSTRQFLPDPVPDEVLARILDNARFAGSGGNRQPWHVIVVRDQELRRRLRDLNQPIWDTYIAARGRGEVPFAPGWNEPDEVAPHAALPLLDQLEAVPVVLIVCARLGSLAMTDQALDRPSIVAGASVYPFVHNLLLAATNEGLGAVLTTLVVRAEAELRPMLSIPETHAVAAMVAIGHPVTKATKLTRRPVDEFTTIDRFDGSALGSVDESASG
jgi:nitroreductase